MSAAARSDSELRSTLAEIEATVPPGPQREAFLGIAQGMSDFERADFVNAVRQFFAGGVRPELKDPVYQASYRERAARFIETAPDDRLLPMVLDALEFPATELDDELREAIAGPKSRSSLAATIRASPVEGVPPDFSQDRVEGTLTDTEVARLHRTLRVLLPLMINAFDQAEREKSIRPIADLSMKLAFAAPVLMLSDPPKSEKYGQKNRSRLLLPSDRKPCQYAGCSARVGNRKKYCTKHRDEVVADRDYEKKKERPTRRLAADHRLASNQMVPKDERVGLAGSLPEEFAPQPEAKRRRRKTDLG
ncbi:MAG: hypothetical protein L3K05_05460 [Thermoplasmata archaeon]|nr:hypothetical protein [Thermoplasmata archaeon]